MTAVAVMRLVERHLVALDRPVAEQLPGFATADPHGVGITVRHLLTHTSGLPDAGIGVDPVYRARDLAGAVAALRPARLDAAPGERFPCTNANYEVAARLLEVVGGAPYAEVVRREVFARGRPRAGGGRGRRGRGPRASRRARPGTRAARGARRAGRARGGPTPRGTPRAPPSTSASRARDSADTRPRRRGRADRRGERRLAARAAGPRAGSGAVIRVLLADDEALVRAGLRTIRESDPRELLTAVQAAAAGEGYLSPRVTGRVLRLACGGPDVRGVRDDERVAGLTARERDVLGLLAQGLSNREIGRELFLAEGTVKAHVAALLDRLGVANRVGAAVAAHRAGLV